jgi:hypothetical protein
MMTTDNDETPLLITIDQEGGELQAFGARATMWPGNMALGAADDTDLTGRSPITGHLTVSFEGFPLGSGIEIP